MNREEVFQRIEKTVPAAKKRIRDRFKARGLTVSPSELSFGGPGVVVKVRAPSNPDSEFLANRAMGDWAERSLAAAILKNVPEFDVIQYGSTNSLASGEPGFKEMFHLGVEEVRVAGKRPDFLLLPAGSKMPADISEAPPDVLLAAEKLAYAAIEVRSSKFIHSRRLEAAMLKGKTTALSFTVKLEDLRIVYRWMERTKIPQIYCQVFFDSIFAVSTARLFEEIAAGRFDAVRPTKSQQKKTLMFPLSIGVQVASNPTIPDFTAETRITKNGRVDAFVVPVGGEFALDRKKLLMAISS